MHPRSRRLPVAFLSMLLLSTIAVVSTSSPTSATAAATAAQDRSVPGAGTPHPRVQFEPGTEDALRAKLLDEPSRTVFLTSHGRALSFNSRPLGDMSITAQRDLSRAAKLLAFEFALDRTVVDGAIVPFADAAERTAVGERVRDLLLNQYPRSRLAVPPPLGGWDRDISTSEEIVNYAMAFDTMLGTDFDFGADRAQIVELLAGSTGELHANFADPATASNFTVLHQNNHRSKSGAAIAIAALVLADDVPQALEWFDFGVLEVDDVLGYMLMTGDGAYAEGPFYYRFTMQNLAPLLVAWERFLGGEPWVVGTVTVPAMHRHPQFARTQQWMLDTTRPDGTMAPIDDGNPGRSYYHALVPSAVPGTAARYWRWADTPQPYETDGNIDVGPDTIVAYDPTVEPAPPSWAPTQFYGEGGTASLRSGWSADALMTLVLGEHDTASEFGRDRTGAARYPQSHEHAEPGGFSLDAFGERLALDPGYLTFSTHGRVNKPEDHNTILVDGAGPADYLQASIAWRDDPDGRPPAEGQATLHHLLDGAAIDSTSVATWYRDTTVRRRFLQADDRYLVIADDVAGSGGSLSWMLHGNGGGTSGGTFTPTESGGRWEVGDGRLDSGVAVVGQDPTLEPVTSIHEVPYTQERTHTALRASVPTGSARSIQVLYPTAVGGPAPVITRTGTPDDATVEVLDVSGDRRVRATTAAGSTSIVDERLDGSLRLAHQEGADVLRHGGVDLVRTAEPGALGIRIADDHADVVVDAPGGIAELGPLGFLPGRIDGACGFSRVGDRTVVRRNRSARFTVHAEAGNATPAADPGPARRVSPGSVVTLDGSKSCDADGDDVNAKWQLVSAPAGSAWNLSAADTFHPQLHADRVGPYRVRLVVTDANGATSLEEEVTVIAGPRCDDGVDDDLDGRIDTDDPDCDGPEPAAPDAVQRFVPVDPTRLLDTRVGDDGDEPWGDGETRPVTVAGDGFPVPANATAVVLNVTAVRPTADTHVTVGPAGDGPPATSNLNLPRGAVRANLVTSMVGGDGITSGAVSVRNNAGTTDLLIDVVGYYAPDPWGGLFTPIEPVRAVDSRDGTGGPDVPWGPGEQRDLVVAGPGAAAPEGVTAVVVNVTVVAPSQDTHLAVWPSGRPPPPSSNVNAIAGETAANLVLAGTGAGGAITIANNAGDADVLVDVVGFYRPTGGAGFVPVAPVRLLDSRDGTGTALGPWTADETRTVPLVPGAPGVPETPIAAVVNLTAVAPTEPTHLVFWATGDDRPGTSVLNVRAGDTRAGLAIGALDADGQVDIANNAGTLHIVGDVVGWFTPQPGFP